jgi:hypothetical protein
VGLWYSLPLTNEPSALWTFEPKDLGAERLWSESDTVNALWSLWSDREDLPGPRSSFACKPTKLEPLKIRYFNIFDRGGNLFELANGCSVQKTAIRFGGWISAYMQTPP